jgi:hypothetical protein
MPSKIKIIRSLIKDNLEVATGNGYLKGTLLNTPDSDETCRFFLISIEEMYKIGAAIELNRVSGSLRQTLCR